MDKEFRDEKDFIGTFKYIPPAIRLRDTGHRARKHVCFPCKHFDGDHDAHIHSHPNAHLHADSNRNAGSTSNEHRRAAGGRLPRQ